MSEFNLFQKIIAKCFLSDNPDLMVEDGKQQTKVIHTGAGPTEYQLYRFDLKEKEFLPFFDASDISPKNLRAFCDYVILAEVVSKLYIILVEMKSGGANHAPTQLIASEDFARYVRSRAEHIASSNDEESFDKNNIIIKKVIVKPIPGQKVTTNPALGNGNVTRHQAYDDIIVVKANYIDVNQICRF